MGVKNNTVEIRDLSIGYSSKKNTFIVAEHINSTIYSGELTCLLGANGIGKSTLLRTLSAFQPQLSGNILIKNKDIKEYTEKELSKVIGVVLTDRLDVKNMTVHDLVRLGRSPYTGFWGSLSSEDKLIVDNAISLIKIEKLSQRMVDTLSDGERQKALIAKALAQDTSVIFLDEPTAFLDFPSKVEIMQLLHRLSRETNKTVFLSTHDLELALQIADRIWLMDKEKGIQIGTPEDLALDGSLASFFARKDILFDPETGLFRVENESIKQIKLIGHGPKYAMIRKALLRNGYDASRSIDSDSYIEIKNDSIILYLIDQSPREISTIEELLNIIIQ